MLDLYKFTLALHDQNLLERKHGGAVELVKKPFAGRYDEGGANSESGRVTFATWVAYYSADMISIQDRPF